MIRVPVVGRHTSVEKKEAAVSNGGGSLSTLYDEELQERATGLEPATSSLGSWHSTN
jgi:hypothetical protein